MPLCAKVLIIWDYCNVTRHGGQWAQAMTHAQSCDNHYAMGKAPARSNHVAIGGK